MLAGSGDKQDPASGWKERSGPRLCGLGVSGREEGQARVGQVPRAAGVEGEDLLSLVRGRQERKLPPVGPQREEKASRGQSITPQRSSFLPPGSDDRCWAQAAAEGVVLATMVTSIFPATSSPGSSPDLAPALPTAGSGHFSLPSCLELVVGVGVVVCGYGGGDWMREGGHSWMVADL